MDRFPAAVRRLLATAIGLALAAIVIAAATLAGQERPNFSGTWSVGHLAPTWTGNANRSTGTLQVGPSVTRLIIRQDAKLVEIIEQGDLGGPNTLVYRVDGSTVSNPFRVAPADVVVDDRGRSIGIAKRPPAEFTTKWKDGKLVSAITVYVPGEKEPRKYEETISLSADGVLSVRIQRVGTEDSRTLNYKKQ